MSMFRAKQGSQERFGKRGVARGEGEGGAHAGVKFPRKLTRPGRDPFDEVEWKKRSAAIANEKGEVIFRQDDIEAPEPWSQIAVNVVASKYFRGPERSGQRESSVRQVIRRVVQTIVEWGRKDGVFATERDAETFDAELRSIIVSQVATFNSPVWFNVGVTAGEKPQASACFINAISDSMESIMNLASVEASLFKGGSGTGTNFSALRSSKEILSGGGKPSGPVSFMRGFDAFAGVIKSGGKTRRAAKMVILNIDHPDIAEFITCKMNEERKAWALISAGYDGGINGEAYASIAFQNANNSVRITDDFMEAVEADGAWATRSVTTGETVDTYRARELFSMIARAAHTCGDPGLQFDTTINRWHTCTASGRINASNPCSEFMFLDDTACNLASVNLIRFLRPDGSFDTDLLAHVVDVMVTAQDIIVDNAKYPTETIARNSHLFRPLGLGFANLGGLLMAGGLPYDSDEGRDYAAAVTALLTGEAYAQSARLAASLGPFERYPENRESMLGVIGQHRAALEELGTRDAPREICAAAWRAWSDAMALGEKHGLRNAQVSVLAPTGTIGFMMDCDTMGIEPDIALIKYKSLVGGGTMRIVNKTVPAALAKLGYAGEEARAIAAYIDRKGTIEGSPDLRDEHLPVFDCALKPRAGSRVISPEGHLKMMAAVQPFISGAISKTVNLPQEATIEDVEDIFLEAWRGGVKAITIYRDGSKKAQPVITAASEAAAAGEPRPARRRLPDERRSITHKFNIAGHEGYLTVGMYEDGSPGEIFIKMAKEGSTISGLMDSFALAVSLTMQYGVPLPALVEKFTNTRFEPSGMTTNPEIRYAKSMMDYIFNYLALKFLPKEEGKEEGAARAAHAAAAAHEEEHEEAAARGARDSQPEHRQIDLFTTQTDAPMCPNCGYIMVRRAACWECINCAHSGGCS